MALSLKLLVLTLFALCFVATAAGAASSPATASVRLGEQAQPRSTPTEAYIPGGEYWIGTNNGVFVEDAEGPMFPILLEPFFIDKFEASVAEVGMWVEATRAVTEAEVFGWSFVHAAAVPADTPAHALFQAVAGSPWWIKIDGATWRHPFGPALSVAAGSTSAPSTAHASGDSPAVHLSWNDATAFCKWQGKRLATESEWEVAAQGGKRGRLFPWGNVDRPKNITRMNVCEGSSCPHAPADDDGFPYLAPVHAFGPQNSFDVHNMVGNVWEWVSDDWCSPARALAHSCGNRHQQQDTLKVKKGGSFLCHKSSCYRYRTTARSSNTPDSSALNIGVRCARDAPRLHEPHNHARSGL